MLKQHNFERFKVRREKKSKASKEKLVEKKAASYPSRYKGELSPEKDVVVGQKKPSYKSRYN